jgi:hypothetical protein
VSRGHTLPRPAELQLPEWPRGYPYRSDWLREVERRLAVFYPRASARDLNLTARSLAPFALAQHDWTT